MPSIRILVVEDNSIVGEDIVLSLKDLGYDVVDRVKTGEAAIQAAQAHRPDLVLMDINLKGQTDGIQAAEKINALFPTPVIYLTAYSDSRTFDRAKQTRPAAYLVKPFVEKDLRISIELAIHNFSAVPEQRDTTKGAGEGVARDEVDDRRGKQRVDLLSRLNSVRLPFQVNVHQDQVGPMYLGRLNCRLPGLHPVNNIIAEVPQRQNNILADD